MGEIHLAAVLQHEGLGRVLSEVRDLNGFSQEI